jgi:hypothetical protein
VNFRRPGNNTLLFGFWVVSVNPGFISCYDPREEVLFFLTSSNSFWQTNTLRLFCLLVSHQGPNSMEILRMFKSSIRIHMFHMRGLTCQLSLKWYFVSLR